MPNKRFGKLQTPLITTTWDPVASWYDGWVGEKGSEYHREVAIPTVIELLQLQPGERILDLGAGQGVLAPHINQAGAHYIGVDASPHLIRIARRRHGGLGQFLVGDARNLQTIEGLISSHYDAVTFLLSIQDMHPLSQVLDSASWALKPGGRVVILMVHPAFRVPRQSGWVWDEARKMHYRRVDSYLTPLAVPMKSLPKGNKIRKNKEGKSRFTTRSFHHPLNTYVNALSERGLLLEYMKEIPAHKANAPPAQAKSAERARREIPLFLGLRARKIA